MQRDTSDEKKLLDPTEAAEYLGVTVWALERWRRQGIGPIYVRLGPLNGGSIRYLPGDLDNHLDARRVQPINVLLEQVLDEAPELGESVTRNAAQWRKTVPHIFDALAVAAEHDPPSLPKIVEAGNRGQAIFRIELPDVPDLGFVEIVSGRTECELARRERLFESSRRHRGGVADPWSAATIVDVRTWRLLERTLGTGVKWIVAQRALSFPTAPGRE
jgi:hypothetical protein